jgi:polyisoprenoid-binding protein YceI
MTASDLKNMLDNSGAPLLLHVLPSDIFAARRIPGSRSACIYEVTFPEQVAAAVEDKTKPILVYGAGGGSLDASVAAERLAALGYSDVRVFPGGLEEWTAAGLPFESDCELPAAPVLDGRYLVDTAESIIRWTGRNLFNHHHGTVRLSGGEIVLAENELLTASFRIAMDSIACDDIADTAMNRMLIDHLRTDDFFDVANHPEAVFTATAARALADCPEGTPSHLLRGRFTLRGVTRELEFPILAATPDGDRLTAQAVLDLDRTQFGSLYGSGRFFRFLGKHIVNDHIHLHLKLHADRAPDTPD